ncbi:hypothetical protein BsWGS_14097 [Bradybaena similaris]
MLLLYRQPVDAENTSSTTATINCKPVTDCRIDCGECEDPFYTFKQTSSVGCVDSPGRNRRQITGPPVPITSPTTIPTTTIGINARICKICSVAGCKKCIDGEETPSCQACHDGYLLNNESRDCYRPVEPAGGLSGEAIAGVVIAVVCIIGISVVIALYVLRKFRGSSNVTGRSERMKDSPKNKKKYCRSSSHENTILAEMGEAPAPPENTYTPFSNKYDPLEKNQNDSELYLPPAQPGEDDLYLNTAAIANELNKTEGNYENTQQKQHNGVNSANSTDGNTSKHPAMTKSQDSIDTYEPVGAAMPARESQEIYANDAAVREDDDVYMNTR